MQNEYLHGWSFVLRKHSLRVDASMGTLWERFDSSIWGTKCVLTPESSYKQSNFQSTKKSHDLRTFDGDYCKTSPSADGVFFSQNTPCELTLPRPQFERGLTLPLGERSVFGPYSQGKSNQISKAPKNHRISGRLKGIIAK